MRYDSPWWGSYFRTLSDYTDKQLIRELEKRGYKVTHEGKENNNAE